MAQEANGSFIKAEWLFCSSCRASHRKLPLPNVVAAEFILQEPVVRELAVSSNVQRKLDTEYLVEDDRMERLLDYRRILRSSYESDPDHLTNVGVFFERYSRVLLQDLLVDVPSFHWFSKAVATQDHATFLSSCYFLYFSQLLFESTGEQTVLVFDGITDRDTAYSQIFPYFKMANDLRNLNGIIEKVPVDLPADLGRMTGFALFLKDLTNDPRSQPLIDEDFIYWLQQVEFSRNHGGIDESAVDRLVLPHMRYVISLVNKYCRGFQFGDTTYETVGLDLIQEGYLSLRNSFGNLYDWRMNVTQLGPVYRSLHADIARVFYDQYKYGHIHVPVRRLEQYKVYKEGKSLLENKLGRQPSSAEISAYLRTLGWGTVKIQNFLESVRILEAQYLLTSELTGSSDDLTVEQLLVEPCSVESEVEFILLRENIYSFLQIGQLKRQSAYHSSLEMLARKLGLWTGEVQTLEEIGSEFGLSRQRIDQRIKPLLSDLRNILGRIGVHPSGSC